MERARLDTPLRKILNDEGRSQAWLARKIGTDARQVWGWVHGLHLPEPAMQTAISEALGRAVEDLWPSDQEPDNHAPRAA
jgi:hypothetical protein